MAIKMNTWLLLISRNLEVKLAILDNFIKEVPQFSD